MASVLLVSTDKTIQDAIEELAITSPLRTRSVASVEAAFEWGELQSFDVLVIDYRAAPSRVKELVNFFWSVRLLGVVSIINPDGEVVGGGELELSGIRVFTGAGATEACLSFLKHIPIRVELGVEPAGILIVEDLDSPRDIIRAYVEAIGFPMVEARESGAKALERLREAAQKFFCVMTDLHMPRMSGIELIRAIREDVTLAHLPVLVLTAHGTPDNLVQCIREGATGFLVKPPRKPQLLGELQKARRIFHRGLSPRLCEPEDADALEEAVHKYLHE